MDQYLVDRLPAETTTTLKEFAAYLKTDHKRNSYNSVLKTIACLQTLVEESKWNTSDELIRIIKTYTQYITLLQSNETVVGNIIRRILKIIREENAGSESCNHQEGLSTFFMSDAKMPVLNREELEEPILDAIRELAMEQETSRHNITRMALEHIHVNEVIMTYGHSTTVEQFLLCGHNERSFRVVVCESGPSLQGHNMALALSSKGIDTTLIADSHAFAIIHTVNKVIMGTHTIMADGALRATNGAHQLALAAKHHSVPVIICASLYKLSPTYLCSYDQDAFNKIVGPGNMVNFSNAKLHSKVQVTNPEFDYVPSDLVELFITNTGGHAPSYLYRIISELYHPNDYSLETVEDEENGILAGGRL